MKEAKIPSQISAQPGPKVESGEGSKIEDISLKLQEENLNLVENWIKERRKEEFIYDRKIPKEERNLTEIFDDINKPSSYIDRIRVPKNNVIEEQRAIEKVWLVVDFDDVINKTTTYQNFLKNIICPAIDLDQNEFNKLYEESKIANNENKKVFRHSIFIKKLKEMNPGKEDLIDKLFTEGINLNDFVDQGMKRALLALGNPFSEKKDIRISVLTFGDIDYQKMRIEKTDIDDVVDDIIYTEGSKREVLETLLKKDYKDKGIPPPIVITLDDSKEQIKDYFDINLSNNFINMHYQNPQGKKSMEESSVEQVVKINEKEKNKAALDFYKICRICLNPDMHLSRDQLYEAFNDKDIGSIYKNKEIKSDTKRKKASRVDSTGRLHNIIFGERDYSEEELKGEVIDSDGFTAYDYYLSLDDPLYPSFEENITYKKDPDGNIIRCADRHRLKKNNEGILTEENIYHHEDIVMRNGEFIYNYNPEEFIENA